jgi:hypothetical protein
MFRDNGLARPPAWGRALIAACGLALGLAGAASAQYGVPGTTGTIPTTPTPTATTPSSPVQLIGIGGVAPISNTGFRLTFSAPYQQGAVWMVNKQQIANGFQTTFQFQISGIGGIIGDTPLGQQQGGDGFAFLIQNYAVPVVGPPAGFLGYDGIPNSLAVQFDTWMNLEPGFGDPNGNYISVHTQGTAPNTVANAASLGQATNIPFMKDGNIHTARVNYIPGTMQVFLDDLTNPVLTIPNLNLSSLLSLDNGSAWLGFTSGTGSSWENHDVVSWQLGPASIPVTATPGTTPTPVTPLPTVGTTTTPAAPGGGTTTTTGGMTFVFP